MISQAPSYHGYRFPPEIISHAVWLYHRFCMSFRDTEDLLAQRGITVSYETIRAWCQTFGAEHARTLRRRRRHMGDPWHLDALFVKIQGQQQYLWRAVDEDLRRSCLTQPVPRQPARCAPQRPESRLTAAPQTGILSTMWSRVPGGPEGPSYW